MKKTLFLVLATLFISVAFAQQQERIIRFHSDIKIETDGRIEVAEHIRVYAGGNEIKRGIIREIPLTRKDKKGKKVRMDYNILSVQRNGKDTPYDIEKESGNLLIYIRDMDVFLDPGVYDFTVVYESYGQVGFFDDFDELYWNVTGTDWIFLIEQASAAITLPGNANAIQTDFYTGVQGATGKDCTVADRGNMQVFTSTRRLAPREGLTVAVAFPRDIISRPPPPTEAEAFWDEHGYGISGWTGAVICLLTFLFGMLKAGKRPVKPVAIPTFAPPRNLSPASIRYLIQEKSDDKSFTATLVEMAVKGAMSIRCDAKKKYSLVNKMNTERLRPDELKMHAAIFGESETKTAKLLEQLMKSAETNSALKESLNLEELQKNRSEINSEVEVNNANFSKFANARSALKEEMSLNEYIRGNKGYIGIGGLILNLIFALYIILTGGTEEASIAFAIASPFIALEIAYLISAAPNASKVGCTLLFASAIITFLLLGALLAATYENGDTAIHWPSVVFFAAMSLAYTFYARRLKMFTAEGAALSAEIDGFKMYMKTAEEHRLNILTPPERTPELFEKLLPYSIALNVANEWCKKFGDVLKRFNYQPEWYNGSENISTTDFVTSFSEMSTSFNRSVTSAQKDPSSSDSSGSSDWSSGSGGGGYSGGGGGGGGGRGC